MKTEVIIPAYNCRDTLNRTLCSLGAQTDNDFSVHVIDDCSTEDFRDILNHHRGLNLRVSRNPVNLGCGMSRQAGIDATEADYIAFLDSDDMLLPYAIETWKNAASAAPNVDMFHNNFLEQIYRGGESTILLHKNGFPWCHGKLYKVSFLRHWGIRNLPEVKYSDDNFFNSVCSELGVVGVIPTPLYLWANNPKSITRSPKSKFNQHAVGDFVHAMRLSVQFVKSKGVTRLKHINATIANIEQIIDSADDYAKNEFRLLLSEI